MHSPDQTSQIYSDLLQHSLRNNNLLSAAENNTSSYGNLSLPANTKFVVSTDTLIAGRHFPVQTAAIDVGYKSLAVNLSDIAAMGAKPVAASLVLVIPKLDPQWLEKFCQGWALLAQEHNIQLIDAQCHQGELAIHVHAYGLLALNQKGLLRSQACVGEQIFVTGSLGDAACALDLGTADNSDRYLLSRLNRPTPRVKAGQVLLEVASACIDLSDGLLADVNHLCEKSHVGASLELAKLPLSDEFINKTSKQNRWNYACSGGDDYELCFTVAADKINLLMQRQQAMEIKITRIGEIVQKNDILENNVMVYDIQGQRWKPLKTGFEHFVE